jgi:hypothetical protein
MPKSRVFHFSLDRIQSGSNILIVGRRGVGKSYLCMELLLQRPNALPIVFASKYVVNSYREKLPHAHVFDHFDAEKLNTLLDIQIKSHGAIDVVIAFDDVTHENACLMHELHVRDVVKYGSSIKLTSIFAVQHAGVYDETFRRNVDYVFAFHDNLEDNQCILFEKYAGMFQEYTLFKEVFSLCTAAADSKHRCLVLDMVTPWEQAPVQFDDGNVLTAQNENSHPFGAAARLPCVYWYVASHQRLVSQEKILPAPWK